MPMMLNDNSQLEPKQPVKIEVKPKKEIFRPKMKVITVKKKEPQKRVVILHKTKPSSFGDGYYTYKGEKYYFTNKFTYTRWQKKQS